MRRHQQTPRSLWAVLRIGAPKNVRVAGIWLLYTFIGIGLSFLVGALINVLTSGHANQPSLIRHGELFAVSASLLIGAMRLVSKDDGLEAFTGRQVVSALVIGAGLASEIGYVLLRLVDSHVMQDRFAHEISGFSIMTVSFVVILVFFITVLDASRFSMEETLDDLENDYKKLSSKMGKLQ